LRAAHADWSVDPRKRWCALAHRLPGGWALAAPEPVGELGAFLQRLAADGRLALGVDLPLGLPRAYVTAHLDEAAGDFPAFLRALASQPTFFTVAAELADIAPERPFYPARGRRGMTRAAHAAALRLGDASGLSRLCDRATASRPAGAPLFWTLGANQTGKAAISAWRDWLVPALATAEPPALWPFEGDFRALLATRWVAIAETYPAEVMRHLGLRLAGSKRRQADRAGLAVALGAAMARLGVRPDAALAAAMAGGFGTDAAGEDRFDCVIGVLGVINVLAGNRPDGVPDDPWLRRWEGWVLGQSDLPHGMPAV
jgi:hypothetical protein